MGVKRKRSTRQLTATQQRVYDILQKEIIERYFEPAVNDDQFELLSTLRYDPCFTNVFDGLRSGAGSFQLSEIDSRLRLLDYDQYDMFLNAQESTDGSDDGLHNLFESIVEPSSSVEDYNDSLMSLLDGGEVTVGSSPPNVGPNAADLYPVFYNRFLLLGEHYKRLNFALQFFKWGTHVPLQLLLDKLIEALPEHSDVSNNEEKMSLLLNESSCYKMRVLVSKSGRMRVEAHPLARSTDLGQFPNPSSYFINTILSAFLPESSTVWNVFIDTETLTVSPFTTFKTTYRDHYNAARKRLTEMASRYGQSTQNEILVFNDAYQLMEGSITNVAVIRHKDDDPSQIRFVTPPLSSGCLCGTMRHYLLKKRLLDEYPIDVRDLREGDKVILFNGVMGCVKGVIRQSYKQN